MLENFKKLKDRLSAPTPQKWRKLGNSLLAVSTLITGTAVALGSETWIIELALFTGILGKFLTSFFVEDKMAIK
jgi:hypothetical protein